MSVARCRRKSWWTGIAVGLLAARAVALELELPLDPADAGSNFLRVAGFGYHVAEHRFDGHPGLDFEYKLGAKVRAAHAGRLTFFSDAHDSSKTTVQIEFSADGKNWRNVYTNLSALEPGLVKGSQVSTGQAIGTAGSVNFRSGNTTLSYAMTHFQLDDLSGALNYGLSNQTALSPVPYFSAQARAAFATLVDRVTYQQQLCEPFMSTPRGLLAYPSLSRTWRLSQGGHSARIDFTCNHASGQSSYDYALFGADDTLLERGSVSADTAASDLPKITFTLSTGGTRLGVYQVNANTGTLSLDYSAPGGSRPANFNSASRYGTDPGATACATVSDALCLVGEASPYRDGQSITLNLAVQRDRLPGTPANVDLWVALAAPNGALWFFTPSGLSAAPAVWRGGLALNSGQSTVVPLLADVPVSATLAGQFTFFGLVAPVGTAPERLIDDKLGNLMAVTTAIQP